MNNTFNFQRFALLFKKHTAENYKLYLMSTGVLAGILLLILGFAAYGNSRPLTADEQAITFMNVFFLAGTIFTSSIFASLGDKKKAVPVLTLPVSHFEKYLVAWIYSLVIFQLVFLICFYAITDLMISVKNTNSIIESELINVFDKNQKIWMVFPAFIFMHSICFLGAVFFEKMHFIKTAAVFFIAMFILFLVNKPLGGLIVSQEISQAIPFASMHIDGIPQRIEATTSGSLITGTMMGIIVVLLWISAYFKLKEKEI